MSDTPETKKLSVVDVLKKLNKNRAEEDKIKLATDYKNEFFQRKTISTGSPYLDVICGKWAKGAYNSIIAKGGTGKTSLALLAAKEEIETTGKYVVYYDGEGTINDSYINRMGVDWSKVIYYKGRNLEEMLDTIEALSTAEDVGLIILDSIPIFTSSAVEAKSASDSNMAVEARKFSARMPIIEGNCSRRDIAIIGLTSYKLDPAAMGDPRQLPRGQWQYTMANTIIELTKKDILLNEHKQPIGHKLDVRVKKSKTVSYNDKDAFPVFFYYEGGFNKVDEYAQLFIEKGVAKSSGAWVKFPDENGEEKTVNGLIKFIEHLKENPNDFEALKKYLTNAG